MKKSAFLFSRVFILFGIIFILYSCRKHLDKPCCDAEAARTNWLLTLYLSQLHKGPGDWDIEMYRFEYDSKNRLIACLKVDYLDPKLPVWRTDSLFYDSRNRLVEIKSRDINGTYSHKKKFLYGAGDRKIRSLKYAIGNNGSYYLSDSTVYVYQDTTIKKISYHLIKNTMDTAIFVYDSRMNLVKAKLGSFDPAIQEMDSYDNRPSPTKYLGLPSIEMEPYGEENWNSEFWLVMQAPVFPQNNYRHRKQNGNDYDYSIAYSSVDTTVSEMEGDRWEIYANFYQFFEYRAGN